ncbi:hypothetical protein AURDEDRAFT_160646 [Auricularia subglabra TFB-10046 SS5]|nr:hypothetical protein AURDEDRAFT_160646 [Auricularia subglabra TFB-10046 SS5]
MAEDYTKRLPAEALSEIIGWVDERTAMHATAHVLRRWRYVAFDRPRRFCWFDCRYQIFPMAGFLYDPTSLPLCLAQLKCCSEHPRLVRIELDAFDVDTAGVILGLLPSKIPYVNHLSITWTDDSCTANVFRALSSHPAPLLTNLELRRDVSQPECSSVNRRSRIPSDIFKGESPKLHEITFTGLDLPEEPLLQFSAVTSVDVEPDSDPWRWQDLLASHFPEMTSLCVVKDTVACLAAPTTTEGQLVLGRLTQLYMNEIMLNNMLDEFPDLSAISSIIIHSPFDSERPLDSRMVARMLAHFAHDDFLLDVTDIPTRDATTFRFTLSSTARATLRRCMEVIFENARTDGHELRLTRAVLSGQTFTTLWPFLPAHRLRGVEIHANPDLPDAPAETPPRELPMLEDFVISRDLGLDSDVPPIILSAEVLLEFLRATLAGPVARLRLADVSLDEVSPAVEHLCAKVLQGGYLSLDRW